MICVFSLNAVKKNAERDGLEQVFATEAEQDIYGLLNAQDFSTRVDFDAIESSAKAIGMGFVATVVGVYLNADDSDHNGNQIPCPCGSTARYSGKRSRTLTTVVGEIEYQRAYYHCNSCKHGIYPKDEAMGLDSGALSPGMVRIIGHSAGRESFAQSQVLIRELAQVRVSTKQVERTAERLGAQLSEYERHQTELESAPAKTMYLGVDGTGVPMIRSETQGIKGKQADGCCKTREMKVVAAWSCDRLDERGHARIDTTSVTYTAAIETAHTADTARELAAFVKRMEREALRRGFYDADIQVVIGDGARWIWKSCQELFPDAVQILDIYHAKEKVWDISKLIYGDNTDVGRQWAIKTVQILKAGAIERLIAILKPFCERHSQLAAMIGYFDRNRERMRYKKFRDQQLCVSSAVVEAGCKNVIGSRHKRAGMHWSTAGANQIAALRASILSDRFDDYWYDQANNF